MWSYVRLDDLAGDISAAHDVLSRCALQVQYLMKLRQAWAAPQAPSCWVDPHSSKKDDGDAAWVYHTHVARSCLNAIKQNIRVVDEDIAAERSPFDIDPNFRLSCRRHEWDPQSCLAVKSKFNTRYTLYQNNSFLQYDGGEVGAEIAFSTALDGIPGTYVRRRDLEVQRSDGLRIPAADIDSAVLCVPIGPSTPRSVARFSNLPISPSNPALLLCAKGSCGWADSSSSIPPQDLSTTLHSMAATANSSLASLTMNWHLRMLEHGVDNSGEDVARHAALPEWAVLIGIVYDSEAVHFVAHIPVTSDDGEYIRYLSILFDTLPFQEECNGDVAQFILGRYKVAFAMLCIQHHIFRLASLWESAGSPFAQDEDEYDSLWAKHDQECGDFTMDMPNPSDSSSGSGLFFFDARIDGPEFGSDVVEAHAREIAKVTPFVKAWRHTVEPGDLRSESDRDEK